MPTPPISLAEAKRRIANIEAALRAGYRPPNVPGFGNGALAEAAARDGAPNAKYHVPTLKRIKALYGIEPDWTLYQPPDAAPVAPLAVPPPAPADILAILRRGPIALDALAREAGLSRGAALDALDARRADGANIMETGGVFTLAKSMAPAFIAGSAHEFVSDDDGWFTFGAVGDNHLG
jgi:hypothetical protein